MAVIWPKFVVNIAINPICAITGLRMGELARLPATDRFQDLLLAEAFAVGRAKGLDLPEAALREKSRRIAGTSTAALDAAASRGRPADRDRGAQRRPGARG